MWIWGVFLVAYKEHRLDWLLILFYVQQHVCIDELKLEECSIVRYWDRESTTHNNNSCLKTEVHNLFGPRAAAYCFQCTRGPKTKLWADPSGVEYKNIEVVLFKWPFIACGLIWSPAELFRIVISSTLLFYSSMKFKSTYKISVIQEMLLVYFNLLQGPDISLTRSGAASGLQAAGYASLP